MRVVSQHVGVDFADGAIALDPVKDARAALYRRFASEPQPSRLISLPWNFLHTMDDYYHEST